MPTPKDLILFFKNGELGPYLAQTFSGDCGHFQLGVQEMSVIVTFPSEASTPSIIQISEAVTACFHRKGFKHRSEVHHAQDSFQSVASIQDSDDAFVSIVITTRYPFPAPGQGTAALRIDTAILVDD